MATNMGNRMTQTDAIHAVEQMNPELQYRLVIGSMTSHTWLQSQPADSESIFTEWNEEFLIHTDDIRKFISVLQQNRWSVMRYTSLAGSTTFRIRPKE